MITPRTLMTLFLVMVTLNVGLVVLVVVVIAQQPVAVATPAPLPESHARNPDDTGPSMHADAEVARGQLIPLQAVLDVMRSAQASSTGVSFDISPIEPYIGDHPAFRPVDGNAVAPSVQSREDTSSADRLIDSVDRRIRRSVADRIPAQRPGKSAADDDFWPGILPTDSGVEQRALPVVPPDIGPEEPDFFDPDTGRIR